MPPLPFPHLTTGLFSNNLFSISLFITSLYFLCFLLLIGMAVVIFARNPRSRLHRVFALSALALLGWLGTLFLFNHQSDPHPLTLLGRLNFVCALFVVFFGYQLVKEIAGKGISGKAVRAVWLLWADVLLLSLMTLRTPWIDRAEIVQGGQHVTQFGPLFPLYILHVVAYLAASFATAFREANRARGPVRRQLFVIGIGMLATAAIALTTNVALPYAFHIFALQDVGSLSTILFLAAVGYAVFAAHLFGIRVIIRAAFVYAGLITLALELYQLAVSFLAKLLPFGDAAERAYAATAIALIVNAFTQQPVRQWLERVVDKFSEGRALRRNPRRSVLRMRPAGDRDAAERDALKRDAADKVGQRHKRGPV